MSAARGSDEELAELRQLVLDHRADRQPVEHATAQFHLGVALIARGRLPQAERALRVSADLFEDHGRPVERAKATNMLGVTLRDQGRLEAAADAFSDAVDTFDRHDRRLEHGAALYNLGLVRRGLGSTDTAIGCFERAHQRFADEGAPRQTAAALRELAAALFDGGRPGDAAERFDEALELASRAGDRAGVGAAANGLGLSHLAAGHEPEAVEALELAVASHPRRIRPGAYAMAQSNLALAYERTGEVARARLAARQASSMAEAAEPVREQAEAVLARIGDDPGTVFEVLEGTPLDGWEAELRPEIERWATLDPQSRRQQVTAWVEGHLTWDGDGAELAAAYLGVLLELPPDVMETLIEDTIVTAEAREGTERFAGDVARAMVRFNVPQFLRLKDTFNRIAETQDARADWS